MAETTPNWKVEEQTPAAPAPTPKQYFSGIVKQVRGNMCLFKSYFIGFSLMHVMDNIVRLW